jgi:hypothetical protein
MHIKERGAGGYHLAAGEIFDATLDGWLIGEVDARPRVHREEYQAEYHTPVQKVHDRHPRLVIARRFLHCRAGFSFSDKDQEYQNGERSICVEELDPCFSGIHRTSPLM